MAGNHTYYKIDCEDAKRMGLSGADKDVYFFIRSFKDGCTMNQRRMAELLCMGEATLIRSIRNLTKRGIVEKVPSGRVVNGGKILTYKVTEPHRQNDTDPTINLTEPHRQNDTDPTINLTEPHRQNDTDPTINLTAAYYKDDTTIPHNNDTTIPHNDDTRAREEEEKKLSEMGIVLPIEKLQKELQEEIQKNGSIAESAMRLYGITPDELVGYVGWFGDKLRIDGVAMKSRGDYRRHFNNWLRIQAAEKQKQQRNGQYSNNQGPAAIADPSQFVDRL